MGNRLLSLREAADRLGVSSTTLWRLRVDGRIRTTRVGRRVLVSEDALTRFAREGAPVVSRRATTTR